MWQIFSLNNWDQVQLNSIRIIHSSMSIYCPPPGRSIGFSVIIVHPAPDVARFPVYRRTVSPWFIQGCRQKNSVRLVRPKVWPRERVVLNLFECQERSVGITLQWHSDRVNTVLYMVFCITKASIYKTLDGESISRWAVNLRRCSFQRVVGSFATYPKCPAPQNIYRKRQERQEKETETSRTWVESTYRAVKTHLTSTVPCCNHSSVKSCNYASLSTM
jgi:hypothetical protein